MFGVWSKILGLNYLWNTLSLNINELSVMSGGGRKSRFAAEEGQASIMSFE